MCQCGPMTLKDAREVFFVKASLVVWMIIALDQGSIVTDKARNKGRFAGKRSKKSPVAMLAIECVVIYAAPVQAPEEVGPWTLDLSHCVEYELKFADNVILFRVRQ